MNPGTRFYGNFKAGLREHGYNHGGQRDPPLSRIDLFWNSNYHVRGNNFHAGPNTRLGSGHAFDRVLDFAVLFENESDGERRVDRAVVLFPGTHHLGAVLVINQLPTAAFNSTQWRSRTLTG